MWWYYQGLREPSDQIAVVKFGASLDAIAGGRESRGILEFIKARLAIEQNDALMKDGRSAASIVETIYGAGRSRMIHGSSKTYSHDWEAERGMAESVGRLCLVAALDWMNANPLETDIRLIRR